MKKIRRNTKRICSLFLILVMVAATFVLAPKTIQAHADDTITINLGVPQFLEEDPGCFSLSSALVTGAGITASMTVNVTNGYIKEKDMSSAIADKYAQHQTITWLWSTPKTMAEVTDFLRSLVFSFAEPMTVTVTLDQNETSIPNGTTVTSYTPAGETSPHYYMYVPYTENPELGHSWLDAYEDAKKQVFMGMIGYLVTIKDPEENAVLDRINNIGAWGGALRLTQASINNGLDKADTSTYQSTGKGAGAGTTWVWVCGPEAGQTISILSSSAAGKAGVNNYGTITGYSNWNTGQPDGGGSTAEFCLQVHHDNTGYWNDLPTTYNELCKGYFVEFSVYEPVAGAYGGTVESYSADKRASGSTTIGHQWNITESKKNSITAYCASNSDETVCAYHGSEKAITFSIDAQDATYTGLAYSGCTLTGLAAYNTALNTSISLADVKYYSIDDDGHDVLLDAVPVEAGFYKAKIEAFGTVIYDSFEIIGTSSGDDDPEGREPYTVGDDGKLPVGMLYGEIDYDTDFIRDTIVYATNSEGNIVRTSFINLTTEKFGTNLNYTYYSINGGRTWTKATKRIDDKKLQTLLKKGFTLWLAEGYNSKTKETTGEVHKFEKILKRPTVGNFRVNYSIYADPSGITDGMWTVTIKDVEAAMSLYWIGVADSTGKKIGEKGFGLWPSEDGVWIKPLTSDGKQVKEKYLIKTAPYGNVPASVTKKITVYGVAKPSKIKVNYSYENISVNVHSVMYFAGNEDLIAEGEQNGKVYVNYIEDTRVDKTKLFRDTDTLPFETLGKDMETAEDYFGKLINDTKEKTAKVDLSKYITSDDRNILVSWKPAEITKPASAKQIIILCKAAPVPSGSLTIKSGTVKLSASKTVKYQVLVGDKWKTTVPKEKKNCMFEIRQKLTAKGGKENDITFATGDEGFMVLEYGVVKAGKTPDKDIYGYTNAYLYATQAEAEAKLAELNTPAQ